MRRQGRWGEGGDRALCRAPTTIEGEPLGSRLGFCVESRKANLQVLASHFIRRRRRRLYSQQTHKLSLELD